ncbi:MAG: gamma-glutamylcyclotransferase family protein [Sphingobium sp.]
MTGVRLPVFVYGTLRTGDVGFLALDLAERVDSLGMAAVAGTLIDLGDYPGAVVGSGGVITGELLMPRDDAVLALLDDYEMFDPLDPAGSEYVRRQIETLGTGLSVWIYVYNRDHGQAPVITSGDWASR